MYTNRYPLGLLGLAGQQFEREVRMTNTLSTIYSSVTTGYTGAFDGLIAIGVSILVVSAGFALVKSMVPHRARVK